MSNIAIRSSTIGLFIALILAAGGSLADGAGEVSVTEVQQALEDGAVVVVDVRSAAEYGAGHVPGAINIPHTAIVADTGLLDAYRDRELVVYCQSGRRAGIAIDALKQAGYGQLQHMDGDMPGWIAAGLPVAR